MSEMEEKNIESKGQRRYNNNGKLCGFTVVTDEGEVPITVGQIVQFLHQKYSSKKAIQKTLALPH